MTGTNGFHGNILVAEHDRTLRDLLDVSLSRTHHNIRMVESGKEAMNLLQDEYFDLAIFEMALPDVPPLEILKRLRASGTPLPHVLILGASGTMDTIQGHIEGGAQDFVVKPFLLSALIARIGVIMRKSQLEQKNSA
jgi:DNA-binding response OmpR family regulator